MRRSDWGRWPGFGSDRCRKPPGDPVAGSAQSARRAGSPSRCTLAAAALERVLSRSVSKTFCLPAGDLWVRRCEEGSSPAAAVRDAATFDPAWCEAGQAKYEKFQVSATLRSQDGGAMETSRGIGVAVIVETDHAGGLGAAGRHARRRHSCGSTTSTCRSIRVRGRQA